MTQDVKRRINDALTRHNGNRADAAAELNISKNKIKEIIRANADLKAIWSVKRIPGPTAVEVINGPDAALAEPEESAEQAAERDEQEFRKCLENIGTKPEDVTEALSLQKMYGTKIGHCVNLIGGGVTKRAMALMQMAKDLDQRFLKGFQGENAMEELNTWNYTYIEVHKVLLRMLEMANLSAVSRAKIKMYQAQSQAGKNRGRTSFGPKTTNVLAQNVTIGT